MCLILFAHDSLQPVGLGRLTNTAAGLAIEDQLVLDVGKAKEAYSLLKAKVLRGLPIGYDGNQQRLQRRRAVPARIECVPDRNWLCALLDYTLLDRLGSRNSR
jgi:Caudovirus prohead serine protease